MNTWSQLPSAEDVNKIDMVDYLAGLEYFPDSANGVEYRYFSPLKKEYFPSFVVFRDTNTWSEGIDKKRRTLLEFGTRYHPGTIGELLRHFADAQVAQLSRKSPERAIDSLPGHQLRILDKRPLSGIKLAEFLAGYRIDWRLAHDYCKEAKIEYNGTIHKAVAFENDAGGYELRGPTFNGHWGPGGTSFLNRHADNCVVFLDVMDLLSYQCVFNSQPLAPANLLVINNPCLAETSLPLLQEHRQISLCLPNNDVGQQLTAYFSRVGSTVLDKSQLYKNHASLSAWVRDVGKGQLQEQAPDHRLKRSG